MAMVIRRRHGKRSFLSATAGFFALMTAALMTATFLAPTSASALTYAAYRPWAQGTARILSLGGAFAAVGDDASNVWISPAMIPLTNSGLDVVLTQGQAFSADYPSLFASGDEKTFRSSFDTTSISFVVNHRWAVGIGDGDPFSEGPNNPAYGQSFLKVHETRVTVGTKLFQNIGIAGMLIDRFLRERFDNYQSGPFAVEQDAQQLNFGASLAWAPGEHWTVSGAFEQGQYFELEDPSGLVPNGNGIQPAQVPAVYRFGVSRRWPELKLLLSTELDLFANTAGLSGFIDSQNTTVETYSNDDVKWVPRVGLEHEILERNWVKSWVRGGFYEEPPRVEQDDSRAHWTLGVESKLWILDFTFAFDHASGYTNASTSLGISLSDYL